MHWAEQHKEDIVAFHFLGILFNSNNNIKTRDKNKRGFVEKKAPLRMILPFKDQRSTNSVWRQLRELSRKIGTHIHPVGHPVYTSRKIGSNVKLIEKKRIVN